MILANYPACMHKGQSNSVVVAIVVDTEIARSQDLAPKQLTSAANPSK